MLLQSVAGMRLPTVRQISGQPDIPGGLLAELLPSQINPSYYHLVKSGRVFHYAVSFASVPVFGGISPNSMPLGMINPVDSGIDAVILQARVCIENLGTPGAGQIGFGFFGGQLNYGGGGPSATSPLVTSAYKNDNTGSNVICYSNTGIPNNLTFLGSSMSTGHFTQLMGFVPGIYVDQVAGAYVCAPGNVLAFGNISSTDSVPSGPVVLSWTWAELPV